MTELSQPELDFILTNNVSPRRKDAFREGFIKERRQVATTEMLFRRAGTFNEIESRPMPEKVTWSGFTLLVQKAPFVDLPNWSPYSPRDFAVPMERHLLSKLEEALRAAAEPRLVNSTNRDADSVVKAFDLMTYELRQGGYEPSLFVLTGPLGSKLLVELLTKVITPYWDEELKRSLQTIFRIEGAYLGIPILDIPDSPSPGIYAVDLPRFATLTRYGTVPLFELDEIDTERALALLSQNPSLVADPPPSPETNQERVRQLQLRVQLKLYETYQLLVREPEAVVGRWLVGEPIEYGS